MAMLVPTVVAKLFLLSSLVAATQRRCADMNTRACELMAQSNPNLCSDNNMAEVACPRFCHVCPIECYHCETTLTHYSDCNTTKICAQHEVCMLKVVTSSVDGHHAYHLSCEPKTHCDGGGMTLTVGKRGFEVRDVSIKCCENDRCNYPVTSTPPPPKSTTKPPTTKSTIPTTTTMTTKTAPTTTSSTTTTTTSKTTTTLQSLTTDASSTSTSTHAPACVDRTPVETCRLASAVVCTNRDKAANANCLHYCGYCHDASSTSTSTHAPVCVDLTPVETCRLASAVVCTNRDKAANANCLNYCGYCHDAALTRLMYTDKPGVDCALLQRAMQICNDRATAAIYCPAYCTVL